MGHSLNTFISLNTFRKPIAYVTIISFFIGGCDSVERRSHEDVVDTADVVSHKVQPDVKIGTDMDVTLLSPVSKAYTELTGVNIEWVPINASDITQTYLFQTDVSGRQLPNNSNRPEAAEIGSTESRLPKNTDNSPLNNDNATPIKDNINASTKSPTPVNTKDSTNHNLDNRSADFPKDIDMLLMHSAYSMGAASKSKRLQPIGSEVLIQTVPSQYQDPNGQWFGLTKYARTLVFNKNKVNEPELHNYAGLGASKWAGRLCMTALEQPENQAIAKMMMLFRGRENAEKFVTAWQLNIGKPIANDEQIIREIEQGRCDVGVIDSDVFWRHAKTNPSTPIRLMWTNQINRGAMTNTITAGLTKEGTDVGLALKFIEWLMSDKGQALLAFHTSTFPIVAIKDATVNMDAIRPDWTTFDEDTRSLADIMADNNIVLPQAEIDLEGLMD